MRTLPIVSLSLLLPVAYLAGCQSLRPRAQPLRIPIVTDSSEIGVTLRGDAYVAQIGFMFTNTTGHAISRAGCGGPGFPDVEKKINGHWIAAYYPISLTCRSVPDYSWKPGAQIRDQVSFVAFVRGHHKMPELEVDSIDGVYRLHWAFTEGRDASVERARQVDAVSNEFRMILRSSRSVEMIGLYEVGFEPRGFRQCNDTATFGNWRGVRFEAGIDSSRWPATRTADSSRVVSLVHWRGKIERPVQREAVSYPRTYVVVHEVLDVRAARLGDCGWDGN